MRLQALRVGFAALLLLSLVLWQTIGAKAQDQGSLADTANRAMQEMLNSLNAALDAPSETTAKANLDAAILAGERAVAALDELEGIATDDVVRSRAEAAGTQTQNAVNKALEARGRSGDALRSGIESAIGEVEEAIEEFAPVLTLVPITPPALPRAGLGDFTEVSLVAIGLAGLALLGLGSALRQHAVARL